MLNDLHDLGHRRQQPRTKKSRPRTRR
jgi:hypothetical protein